MSQSNSLATWLERLERMQPDRIELGLQRIISVAEACDLLNPAFRIITVAGTNGKGSTVAYAANMLAGCDFRVGVYTSPHFLDFNERVVVDGRRADDDMLCEAFSLIDSKRKHTELTYFEFTTLAAINIFKLTNVDIAVLEVGLGGRLDAVNAWDCDVGCVTSIGVDHQEWLGNDREAIGREKAGIARADTPLICGDPDMPKSIAAVASERQARLLKAGSDFSWQRQADGWCYQGPRGTLELPLPRLAGHWAIANASVAITACAELLGEPPARAVVSEAMRQVTLPGRMQQVEYQGVPVLLDVAHNPQAAAALADHLQREPACHTIAVFSCMKDKDAAGIVASLSEVIDFWYIVQLGYPRAFDGRELRELLAASSAADSEVFTSVIQALDAAVAQSADGSRIVVFGSFHVVGPVLRSLEESD